MKTFRYSFFARLIYRYANFPITFLLTVIVFLSSLAMLTNWYYAIPVIIDLAIIYFMNRYFFRSYKTFPYKIEIDTKKIICSDFFFSKRVETILLEDITSIKGGIFSGTIARPIYLYAEKQNLTIGINQHIKDYNKIVTIILSNIKQELYKELLETMQQYAKETLRLKDNAKSENLLKPSKAKRKKNKQKK